MDDKGIPLPIRLQVHTILSTCVLRGDRINYRKYPSIAYNII